MSNLFDIKMVFTQIPDLLTYLPVTLELAVVSMIVSLILGLILALIKMKKIPVLKQLANLYISVIRGTPVLVQLYVTYFGIPMILKAINLKYGTNYNANGVAPIIYAFIALAVNESAYNAEVIRASLESVPKGQIEAANALGMTYFQALRRVILPEAIVVALPSLGNSFIGLIKGTSLAFVCAVVEMTAAGKIIAGRTYRYFEVYVSLAIIYWIITIIVEQGIKLIEKKIRIPENAPAIQTDEGGIEPMIEVKNISKKFNNNVVLNGIDLNINKGDVVAIIGPSGTGKSTFLRCLNRLEKPESGSISIGDLSVDLARSDKKSLVELRKKTSMVFQGFNLFSKKTALENVMEGLIIVKKMDKKKAEEIAREQLKNVGLLEWANHYPAHLSGGQQQRVAIARALAMEPELLLLDEPTSALDPELVGEVLDTIKKAANEGYTMLLVSHEMNFVKNVATRVIFLENGKIIEDGPPKEVFNHPKSDRVREFFAKINRMVEPEYSI